MRGLVENLPRRAALAGGLLIVAIIIATVAEITLRGLLGISLGAVHELTGYAFGVGTSLSLAYAFQQRSHIRIDILYAHLPRWWRFVLDLVALSALTAFASFLLLRGWDVFSYSFTAGSRSNSTLAAPLVIPQGLWVLGILIFIVTLVVYLIRAVIAVVRRDGDWFEGNLAPPSNEQAAIEEVKAVVQTSGTAHR